MIQFLKNKKTVNMIYGLGAAIVLIGALFKITHFKIGPLTGGVMLTIGLLTEAFIFFVSAFEPVEEDLDWTKVYPELAGGTAKEKDPNAKGVLTKKLDEMLKEAQLDVELVQGLSKSIQNFQEAAESIKSTTQTVANTNKYNEELAHATSHLASLNQLYKSQAENTERQAVFNESMWKHSQKLEAQMQVLSSNLASLNSVYEGMLSAMNK